MYLHPFLPIYTACYKTSREDYLIPNVRAKEGVVKEFTVYVSLPRPTDTAYQILEIFAY